MFLGGLFSKEYRRPLFYCSVAVIGAVTYGYDGTYFTGILAMKRFVNDYGERNANGVVKISTGNESLLTSIVQAGEFFGALFAGPIGDYGGRRAGFIAASILITIGVVLQLILVGSVPLLTIGRLVLGMGVGVISNAVPMYLSEIPPTAIRGAVVSSWQLMLAIGQVIGACVDQGTKEIESTASYRIPIGLNILLVLLLTLGTLFVIPESPRWLISKNRDEKAEAALVRINKDQIDAPGAVAQAMETLTRSREDELTTSHGAKSRWSDLWKGTTRRRFVCAVGILICQQIGGVQFIFSYTTVFMSSLGLASPFVITIIVDVVEVVGVICSFFIVNRFGRRPILLYNSAIMAVVLFICGGLGCIPADQRTNSQNQVIAAMIILYVFFFNLSWGPIAWVVASELATGRNRQKIMSVGTACFWITAWAVTFTLPYLYNADQANLNAKIGFIYGVGTLISMAFVYFFIPETLGKSLEQINTLMEENVPTKEWANYVFHDDSHTASDSIVGDDTYAKGGQKDHLGGMTADSKNVEDSYAGRRV